MIYSSTMQHPLDGFRAVARASCTAPAGGGRVRPRSLVGWRAITTVFAISLIATSARAQADGSTASDYPPDIASLARATQSEMRNAVERFTSDQRVLLRRYRVAYSPARRAHRPTRR